MFSASVGTFNKKGTEISRTVQDFFYMFVSVKSVKIRHVGKLLSCLLFLALILLFRQIPHLFPFRNHLK